MCRAFCVEIIIDLSYSPNKEVQGIVTWRKFQFVSLIFDPRQWLNSNFNSLEFSQEKEPDAKSNATKRRRRRDRVQEDRKTSKLQVFVSITMYCISIAISHFLLFCCLRIVMTVLLTEPYICNLETASIYHHYSSSDNISLLWLQRLGVVIRSDERSWITTTR